MSSAVLLPIYIIIFVALIYFVGIRPQQRRRRELEELSRSLRPGEEIITTSGIYGIVSEVEDGGTIILQVAEDVDIRVSQGAIARKTTGDAEAGAASDGPATE
jgi:preprotein translocase subunit YajC